MQELADSSYLLADKALNQADVTRAVRTYARKLYAEIAVRIVAYGADMVFILFAMTFLADHVLNVIGLDESFHTVIWVLLLGSYFVASWASPMRATPLQFLFGMRVLHETGRRLSWSEAAIRSATLVALWGVAMFVLRQFFVPGLWLKIAAVGLLLYVPSISARRQGLHDFLAHSVVVNRRALRSVDDERRMREFLADRDVAVSSSARPSIYKMLIDAVVLALPLLLMSTGIQVAHQKNMYGRVAYAMGETHEMKYLAQNWFEATGKWPTNEIELGRPLRKTYPAGGYFQMEDDGVIRIQFEIVPELKNGSILIEPRVENGDVTWHCRTVGDIGKRYLPGSCRNQ